MANSLMLMGAGKSGASAAASSYDPPAVTSGLVVKLDVADPDSWDSGASTKWVNTVDDEEGDFINGPVFDDTDDIVSIQYDGSDDYFELVRDNSDLDSGWTINMWLNPQERGSPYGYLIAFGDGSAAYTGNDLTLATRTWNGKMTAYGMNSAYSVWGESSQLQIDEWQMLSFVNQNNGTYDLFLDGVKNTSPVEVFNTDVAPNDDIYLDAFAGALYAGPETKISQFLLYDRSLSDAEIEDLFDGDKARFGLS